MADLREVLLRVVGEADAGEIDRELTQIEREIQALDGTDVKAEVELETRRFKDELKSTKAELASLATQEASPEVDLQTAGLQAHIKEVQAQLAILDARDVDIDVNVDRDGSARSGLRGLVDLGRQAWDTLGNLLAGGAQSAGQSMVGMGGSAGSSGANVGFMASIAAEAAAVVGVVLVAAIGSAIVALVALASSAIAAAAGLGALATAALALIGPFAALAVGAIARFKEEADKAGTAANRLKTIAGDLADAFKSTLAPAADAVFRGVAIGIKALIPTIRSLRPEFTAFGQVAGNSLRNLLLMFASPAWRDFFSLLVKAAAQALPALTSSFSFLATIMRQIATASMPFLLRGLRSLTDFLGGLAAGTSNAKTLRSEIGGLVTHLRAWLKLSAALGSGFFGLIRAAAPVGLELVRWLTQGARKIADWVNSAQGQERIKQFFSDTLPLVKEMVTFFGQLAIIGAQLFQALAPALTTIFQGLNLILRPVIFLLELFDRIPASVRSWIVPFGAVIATVTSLISITRSLGVVWGAVGSAAQSAWNAIRGGASTVFSALRTIATAAIDAVRARLLAPVAAFAWVLSRAKSVFAAVRAVAQAAAAAVSAIVSKSLAAWAWITQKAKAVASATRGVISGLASKVGGIVSRAAGNAWHWISEAAQRVAGVVRGVVSALVGWIKDRINDAITVIQKITQAINAAKSAVESFVSTLDSAIDKAGDLVDKVKSLPGKALGLLAGGTRNWPGGLAIIGEQGPELVNLPAGSDVFSTSETARIMRQLTGALRGQISPDLTGLVGGLPAPAAAAATPSTQPVFHVTAPPGEAPDVGSFLALADMKTRARNQR